MKNLKLIFDFLKKNWKYTVLVLAVIAISTRGCIRDQIITKQASEIAELNAVNSGFDNERQGLRLQLEKLSSDYAKIEVRNDSLKKMLAKYQTDLRVLKEKHKKEITELLNVPADTIYLRLQTIYVNYDGSYLKFPFSASQIKSIYTTALEYPQLQDEYTLQGKTLKSCFDLNNNYEQSINNLNLQIGTLNENIGKSDKQIENYKAKEAILNKQVDRNKFWKRTLLVTSGVLTGIVILK